MSVKTSVLLTFLMDLRCFIKCFIMQLILILLSGDESM